MTKKSQVRNLPRLQRQRVKFSNRHFWLDIMCTIQNDPFLNFGAYICGNLAGIHPVQLRDFQKSAKNHKSETCRVYSVKGLNFQIVIFG